VRLVNGSHFLHVLSEQFNSNVTNRTTPAKCMLVFFFAPWCPFSAEAAPHFNAFGRIYSDLPVLAVDSSKYVNRRWPVLKTKLLSGTKLACLHNMR
jgi:thiol-disulfide isomerase/thioredoxin